VRYAKRGREQLIPHPLTHVPVLTPLGMKQNMPPSVGFLLFSGRENWRLNSSNDRGFH